jgi:hypothetical protein
MSGKLVGTSSSTLHIIASRKSCFVAIGDDGIFPVSAASAFGLKCSLFSSAWLDSVSLTLILTGVTVGARTFSMCCGCTSKVVCIACVHNGETCTPTRGRQNNERDASKKYDKTLSDLLRIHQHYITFVSIHYTVRTFWFSLCSASGSAPVRPFVFLVLRKDSGVRSFSTFFTLLNIRSAFTPC